MNGSTLNISLIAQLLGDKPNREKIQSTFDQLQHHKTLTYDERMHLFTQIAGYNHGHRNVQCYAMIKLMYMFDYYPPYDENWMYLTVRSSNDILLRFLIEKDLCIYKIPEDCDCLSLLRYAIKYKIVRCIEPLLKHPDCLVFEKKQLVPLLVYAIRNDARIKVVRLLLKYGMDVNINTPVYRLIEWVYLSPAYYKYGNTIFTHPGLNHELYDHNLLASSLMNNFVTYRDELLSLLFNHPSYKVDLSIIPKFIKGEEVAMEEVKRLINKRKKELLDHTCLPEVLIDLVNTYG